jgi:hypothetical protein
MIAALSANGTAVDGSDGRLTGGVGRNRRTETWVFDEAHPDKTTPSSARRWKSLLILLSQKKEGQLKIPKVF